MAGLTFSEEELFRMAETKIKRARDEVGLLMEKGIVKQYKGQDMKEVCGDAKASGPCPPIIMSRRFL